MMFADKIKVVYSTNPDFKQQEEESKATPAPSEQLLYVSLQRLKGNKIATLVEGFVGNDDDLEELGKLLKTKCGTGGTVKDGEIIIQGEKREQVMKLLSDKGYKVKKKGG
jgi:translation initiation factor 1